MQSAHDILGVTKFCNATLKEMIAKREEITGETYAGTQFTMHYQGGPPPGYNGMPPPGGPPPPPGYGHGPR